MSSREQLTDTSEDSAPPASQTSDAVRSTLRPTGDEPPLSLQPSVRRPMVVVRSGDGANVPDWAAESPTPPVASEITAIPSAVAAVEAGPASVREEMASEPAPSEPFPLARDLEPPPPSARIPTDRASAGAPSDPALDSPELQSGSLPLGRRVEPAPQPVPTLAPSQSAASGASVAPSVRAPGRAPERTSSRFRPKLAVPAALAALFVVYLGTRGTQQSEQPAAEKPGVPAAPALNAAPEPPVAEEPPEMPVIAPPSAPSPAAKAEESAPSAPSPAAKVEESALSAPSPAAKAEEPAEPTARKASPSGVTTKPVPPGATRVRLEVHPADSKVGKRGVTQKPPYEFDVPKGKKVVLEVLRKGYTTRKVTLDGSSPRVVVGLARARSGRGSR